MAETRTTTALKCVKVILDGKILGPFYSDKITLDTLFDTLEIDKTRFTLYDLEGHIKSKITMDSPYLDYGIYELLPNTVSQSLHGHRAGAETSSPTYNAAIQRALQDHSQALDSHRIPSQNNEVSMSGGKEWPGVLSIIRANLTKFTRECRDLARKYKYDTHKYKHQVLFTLHELRTIESILEKHAMSDDTAVWDTKFKGMRYVCQCLVVEYMDILDNDCPPFYPSPVINSFHASQKSNHLQAIRGNMKTSTEPDLIAFSDHNTSRKLRRSKINYIKSLIETDSFRDSQLNDVMEVVGNLETLRQNGLLGRSRCHGKYDLYPVQDIKRHLAHDFRIDQSKADNSLNSYGSNRKQQ